MVDIAALNSRVKFDKLDVPFNKREILGDATETGLSRFAGRYLQDYDAHHQKHPKVFEVPFNSTNKWALVIVSIRLFVFFETVSTAIKQVRMPHADGQLVSYIKGAPERVLAKCSTYLNNGKVDTITPEFREAYDQAYDVWSYFTIFLLYCILTTIQYMASRGHRVIACAQKLLPETDFHADYQFAKTDYPSDNYCFVGLVSLEDPPKHGVREAIGTLRLAGIKVMMVTGTTL